MLNGELQAFWQPSLQEGVLKNNQPLRDPKINTKNTFFFNWKNRLEPTCHTVSWFYESASFPDKCFMLLTFNYTGSYLGQNRCLCLWKFSAARCLFWSYWKMNNGANNNNTFLDLWSSLLMSFLLHIFT